MVENPQLGDRTEKALLDAQRNAYVARQKHADFLGKISGYLFWAATSTMAATAIGAYKFFSAIGASTVAQAGEITLGALTGTFTIPAAAPISGLLILGLAAVSITALAGSILTSRRAKEIASDSHIVFSELDSKIKSKGLVQEFAKTQYNAKHQTKALTSEVIDTEPRTPWAERIQQQSPTQSPALTETKTQTNDWVKYIAQQAQEEDLQKLADLQGARRF